MPGDYILMAESLEVFILEEENRRIGFVTIKRIDEFTAEIPLVYFVLEQLGKGYGTKAMKFIEEYVIKNWPEVNRIFLDTIIPEYNGGFYKKMGYVNSGESVCEFDGLEVKAQRFEKIIE